MIRIKEATKKGYVEIHMGECFDAENPNSETRRGRKMEDKSNCLMAKDTDFMRYEGPRIITLNGKKVRVLGIRRLTPSFEYRDGKAPPITTSSWQHNNFLVIEDDTDKGSDEEGLRGDTHGSMFIVCSVMGGIALMIFGAVKWIGG